jgi:D-alanine-D-alanine ligase
LVIGNNKLRVAVLTGGIGTERPISIQSGQCVAEALKEAGFDVVTADIRPDNLDILEDTNIDVFFPALHGEFGEDGQLQQILEDKSLLYTGSGPTASQLAFDKMASKKLFAKVGVATPAAVEFNAETDIEQLENRLKYLGDEYVVKPIKQGSSVGVRIVAGVQEAIGAAGETFAEFSDCMIEKFIPGKEITVSILEDRALPIVEIRSQTGFYDYQAKYIDEQTEYLFDTIRDPDLIAQIEKAAMNCFYVLGCRHYARVDFILSDEGIAHALELNTIPGFTTHSLLPKAAAKTGLSMSDLCAKIVEAAYSSLLKCKVLKVYWCWIRYWIFFFVTLAHFSSL